jgi:hypothetical protein
MVDENTPDVGGRRTLGPPKSDAGKRQVSIPSSILGDVDAHLDRFVAAKPEAWVFTRTSKRSTRPELPGRPLPRGRCGRAWSATRSAGVRPSPPRRHLDSAHSLRDHQGAHIPHRPFVTRAALMYQHATAQSDKRIADAMGVAIDEAASRATVLSFEPPCSPGVLSPVIQAAV